MFVTVKRTWIGTNVDTGEIVDLGFTPGRHRVERVTRKSTVYLIRKGTRIGVAEERLRKYESGLPDEHGQPRDASDWEVIIED